MHTVADLIEARKGQPVVWIEPFAGGYYSL